ncbi:hypothetical protein, partial [Akkermansia muciniphila]|uniref:hypothetical protein n=1 Tax=Akkermansia muciniphila TaxID=239935 RepID=UPI00319DAFCD
PRLSQTSWQADFQSKQSFSPFPKHGSRKKGYPEESPRAQPSGNQGNAFPRMRFSCPEKQNRPIKSRTGGLPTAISVHTLSSP